MGDKGSVRCHPANLKKPLTPSLSQVRDGLYVAGVKLSIKRAIALLVRTD